ncbi:MAG: hypothetical protein EOM05_11975 [Clostridia bacterium]|nr:hypothetical protein [Clostridia bacterium]
MSKLKSCCTCCGKETPIENLHCAPDTEAYYRQFGTALLHKTAAEHVSVDVETLVCPGCYENLFAGGKKAKPN